MRLLLLVLLPTVLQGQGFATLEGGIIAIKGDYKPGAIITFSGGGFVDQKGDAAFMLGAGVTIDMVNPDDLYAAPFFLMGYFNPRWKITPYVNAHIGYGFYKGSGKFADVHSNKGGLFTDIRTGAGFKVTKLLRITPYIGVQGLSLRYVIAAEVKESHFAGLVHGGVALVFSR